MTRWFEMLLTGVLVVSGWGAAHAGERVGEQGAAYDAQTEVELIAERASIRPGEPLTLGVRMAPDESWYTYWKNPGGSGEAPSFTWHPPEGFEVGEPRFPTPERHEYEVIGTNNYGYSREVVLPVSVDVPEQLAGDSARIAVEARWLSCDPRECIPGNATLALELPVRGEPPEPSRWAPLFEAARASAPRDPGESELVLAAEAGKPVLHFRAPGDGPVSEAYFFPEPRNLFDYGASQPLRESSAGHALELTLLPSAEIEDLPERLRGVLTFTQDGAQTAWQVDHPVEEAPEGAPPGPARESTGAGALLWAIVLALVGGMFLNLMPCVFPILSLKVLGLLQTQGGSRRHARLHGVGYGAGVLVSFWVLAFLLIAIRGAGAQLSWGFHLQSPAFIAVMALLVFAIGLNLAGVFEIGVGVVNLAGRAEQRIGGEGTLKGAFGTGVLATALATPCTAPLMGPAVGFALSQPPAVILAVLTALGFGMALPYVVLYWVPAVGRVLPRPGQWMATFKQALSFPMFAVAVWLVWVFGNQVGHSTATLVLLSALLVLALALWIYGRWSAPERSVRVRWVSRTLALCLAAVAIAAPIWLATGARAADALPWEPYSEAALQEVRDDPSRMAFVDFTADWCVNCQVLEQTVLASDSVTEAFADHDVVLFKADWTSHDDEITEALARFGRRSVPFFVLYPPEPDAEPIELGDWITRGEVTSALERAATTSP